MNAKLDEQKKSNNQAILSFGLSINTKPNVVKYTTTGIVTLEGSAQDIKKKLEVNPKTNIPQILFTVYQHVFNSIYLLSSILNMPYPPPDLLHPMQERIQILPSTVTTESQQATAEPEATSEKSTPDTTTTAPTEKVEPTTA